MPKIFIDPKSLKTNRFEINNKTSESAEILLYGAIGSSIWDDSAISAKQFAKELEKLPSTVKEIHLRVNSPGGSVFEGHTIYERLKTHKAKVIVYIDGLAASIASVIAMAGDEIHMGEGAFMMIHRPWTFAMGNSSEMERQISLLDKLEDAMTGIYSRKTGLTRAEISDKMQEDFWMNADEAVELGFATDKTEESETLHMAASYLQKADWIKKGSKPTIDASNKIVKTKKAELLAKIENFQARTKS
jgi:ATP-dependent Clp protease, protease subunit